jgi:hypothetical protein
MAKALPKPIANDSGSVADWAWEAVRDRANRRHGAECSRSPGTPAKVEQKMLNVD